jgi:hypothetical protein
MVVMVSMSVIVLVIRLFVPVKVEQVCHAARIVVVFDLSAG